MHGCDDDWELAIECKQRPGAMPVGRDSTRKARSKATYRDEKKSKSIGQQRRGMRNRRRRVVRVSEVQTHIGERPPADGNAWDCQCAHCGSSCDWQSCYNCEDGYSHHDCGEDCCCCIHPEDNVTCDICRGYGGWWSCLSSVPCRLPNTRTLTVQWTRLKASSIESSVRGVLTFWQSTFAPKRKTGFICRKCRGKRRYGIGDLGWRINR